MFFCKQKTAYEMRISDLEFRRVLFRSSVTDVTDQPGSDMNFHTLADHIPQHVWMANADGEIFWHNRQWHDYTGLGEEEARGLVWSEITHEAHRERVVNGYLASIRSGEPWHANILLRRHDGDWSWFLAPAAPA